MCLKVEVRLEKRRKRRKTSKLFEETSGENKRKKNFGRSEGWRREDARNQQRRQRRPNKRTRRIVVEGKVQ